MSGVVPPLREDLKRNLRGATIGALEKIGIIVYGVPIVMLDPTLSPEMAEVVIYSRIPVSVAETLPEIPESHEPRFGSSRTLCLLCGGKHQPAPNASSSEPASA